MTKEKSIEQKIKENKYFVVDRTKNLQILIETGHTWREQSCYDCVTGDFFGGLLWSIVILKVLIMTNKLKYLCIYILKIDI